MELDGSTLTIETLSALANGSAVSLSNKGLERMTRSRAVIDQVIAEKRPVYGVTTGLGAKSTQVLDHKALSDFSLQTLRGRAHAIGPEESVDHIRAGLTVRLNTLLLGFSGARPVVAQKIAECLNARLTPVVGQIGSIGASDLVINATVGLALMGEGEMIGPKGRGPSGDLMRAHGISPLDLAPRDGLALANHTGAVAGSAALAFAEATTAFEVAQTAAALSMEGFRANTSPLDPRVLAAKHLPGQSGAAAGLLARLEGSRLFETGHARRLQDPLSIRNVAQIHGGVHLALSHARPVIEGELNGSSDNPITLVDAHEVLSGGAYFTTELGLVCEGINRAFVQMAMSQIARIAKLLDPDFSGLSLFLAKADSGSNGFAPVMKTAEALLADLGHAAQPAVIWPSLNANGVEDCLTTAPVAARALHRVSGLSQNLSAIELMIAAQAVDLRDGPLNLGPFLAQTYALVRKISPMLQADRPLSREIGELCAAIASGAFDLKGNTG